MHGRPITHNKLPLGARVNSMSQRAPANTGLSCSWMPNYSTGMWISVTGCSTATCQADTTAAVYRRLWQMLGHNQYWAVNCIEHLVSHTAKKQA